MSWSRYQGRAPAAATLTGEARDAELEGYLRLANPHLTDIRLERATATDGDAADAPGHLRWYRVTYLADDGEGYETV